MLREVGLVYAGVGLATAALGAAAEIAPVRDLAHLGIAALFLGVPLAIARRRPGGPRSFGIDLGGLLEPAPEEDPRPAGPLGLFDLGRTLGGALPSAAREVGFALAVAVVVFPPFAAGFAWWYGASRTFEWTPSLDLGSFALTQLVLIALPEEAMFRGYVQTRLHQAWPPRYNVLGAQLNLGVWVAQAALFALVHLAIDPQLQKLAVFFPGLLFGWVRARRGGIGAAVALHAASNVFSDVLARGWL